MKQSILKNKYLIVIFIAVAAVIITLSFITTAQKKVLDESEFKELYKQFQICRDEGGFTSQEHLRDFILDWARVNHVEYKVDNYDNIIFDSSAVSRKKNVSPTVVCCGYNYETALSDARVLVSAMMIAGTETQSGRKTVIICNDEQNKGVGYRHISKKLLSNKSKVIYLDYGNSSYISCSSFAESFSDIVIPAAKKKKPAGDTAVRVHISGVTSGEVTTAMNKHPDVISAFSTLLSRLKSKSTVYQLADVSIGANGNMYPVSMNAEFVLNSYNVGSFTGFINTRIKAWEKAYGSNYEDLEYTYEVISDPDKLPKKAYSAKSTDKLASVLYTLKSGTYKYDKDDDIPEDRTVGDTCGLNYILDISEIDDGFRIHIMTQGYNRNYIDKIQSDDKTVAELYNCKFDVVSRIPAFFNNKDSLVRTLRSTHSKISNTVTPDGILEQISDNYFTPCSYLSRINNKADIVHLRLNKSNAAILTNTILCYIKTKGNLLSL